MIKSFSLILITQQQFLKRNIINLTRIINDLTIIIRNNLTKKKHKTPWGLDVFQDRTCFQGMSKYINPRYELKLRLKQKVFWLKILPQF